MVWGGSGDRLPLPVLVLSAVSTVVAVVVSGLSIYLQLKNYRKPCLQREVIRIMIMVPVYAIASLISLFSVEAAFVIDAIRDIYEAFVIYCFFSLLLSYLGGERSLLIMLHGRPPKEPVFPMNLFKREIDVSDPYTFLFLKRGIFQYVQVKPILAAVTLILKACGKFNEGDFRANSGYLYVSIVYNTSICLALYCLAVFWMCVNDDLKPYRPVPKFLCVKGILFFSFWQSVAISALVAARVITKLGPYTDPENVSVGLNDTLICLEMPFFAIAHMYAFSYKDYIDPRHTFVARMPMYYATRDAFGLRDVFEDSKAILRGEGMDYRDFEPAEGFMHQGVGRERRIRAGLRYSKGGRRKYWLPKPTEDTQPPGRAERAVNRVITKFAGPSQGEEVHAPLLQDQAEDVVHLAPDLQSPTEQPDIWGDPAVEDGYELPFGDLDDADEQLFTHSKQYLFGDYNYPCIDVSSESARSAIWTEEERVLRDERGAWFSPLRGAKGQQALQQRDRPAWEGYGAVSTTAWNNGITRHGSFHAETRDGDGRVIDHEQDRAAMGSPKDVKLKWTKLHGQQPRSISHAQSQSPHLRTRYSPQIDSSSSTPSSGSGSQHPHSRPSPSISRHSSRNSTASPVLPADAVDLIVEDTTGASEERERDRRKGEPAMRGSGLRKIYRRGFVVEHGDERKSEGQIEVEDPSPSNRRRVDAGEEMLEALGHKDDDYEEPADHGVEPSEWTHEAEGLVARAGTPPLHARLQANTFVVDDDNPWA
ncbi:organic solute transporter Ostalpha-domain-containing protein [Cyathus striatus]|nr:organic solute transporter Ostalpha-domain-containing protein [Cyathus striatus]